MLQSKLGGGDQKKKRERKRQRGTGYVCMYICVCMCACVHAARFIDWVHFQLLERLVVWLVD